MSECCMSATWVQHEFNMNATWVQHECNMNTTWVQHECNMSTCPEYLEPSVHLSTPAACGIIETLCVSFTGLFAYIGFFPDVHRSLSTYYEPLWTVGPLQDTCGIIGNHYVSLHVSLCLHIGLFLHACRSLLPYYDPSAHMKTLEISYRDILSLSEVTFRQYIGLFSCECQSLLAYYEPSAHMRIPAVSYWDNTCILEVSLRKYTGLNSCGGSPSTY